MTTGGVEGERERLLGDLLTGLRAADDPEVVRFFREHPDAREEFEELRQMSAMLDAAGTEERGEVREALAESPSAADVARARSHLAVFEKGRRSMRWLWVAAAAVVLVAVGYLLSTSRDEGAPRNEVLGNRERFELSDDWSEFRWQVSGGPDDVYQVEVHDGAAAIPSGDTLLFQSDEINGDHWAPEADDLAKLVGRTSLLCRLIRIDADGERHASEIVVTR